MLFLIFSEKSKQQQQAGPMISNPYTIYPQGRDGVVPGFTQNFPVEVH